MKFLYCRSNYDLSKVEVNDYNVATDGKNIFDQPINNDFKTIENIASSQGDDYATGFLVDYPYFKPNHKMIAIDLSKQQALDADPKAIQQISFTANLHRGGNTIIPLITEEAKKLFEIFYREMSMFCKYVIECSFIEYFNFYQYKMDQYNSLNVNFLSSQLNKLKLAIKNK